MVCLPPAGQRGVSSPRAVSTTAEAAPPPPPPPPSSPLVLSSPKPAVAAGSVTGSGNSGNRGSSGSSGNSGNSGSAWLSARGSSADPNTEATSGTSSAAAPPTTRCRTVAGGQAGQWVELHLVTVTTRGSDGTPHPRLLFPPPHLKSLNICNLFRCFSCQIDPKLQLT